MAIDFDMSREEKAGGEHGKPHLSDANLSGFIEPILTGVVGVEENGDLEDGPLDGAIVHHHNDTLQYIGLSEKAEEAAANGVDKVVERSSEAKRVECASQDPKANAEEKDVPDTTSDEENKEKDEDIKQDTDHVTEVVASVTSHATPSKKPVLKQNRENVDANGLLPPPSPSKIKRKRSLGTFINDDHDDHDNTDTNDYDDDDAAQLQKRMRYTAVGESVGVDAPTTDEERAVDVPKEPENNAQVDDDEERAEESEEPKLSITPEEPATTLPIVPADNGDVAAQPAPAQIDSDAILATPQEPVVALPLVPAGNDDTIDQPAPAHVDIDVLQVIAQTVDVMNERYGPVANGGFEFDFDPLAHLYPQPLIIADEGGYGQAYGGPQELQAAPLTFPYADLPVVEGGEQEQFNGGPGYIGFEQPQAAPFPFWPADFLLLEGGEGYYHVDGGLEVAAPHDVVAAWPTDLAAYNDIADQPAPVPQDVNAGVAPADVMPAAEVPGVGRPYVHHLPCPIDGCRFLLDEIWEPELAEHFRTLHDSECCTMVEGALQCLLQRRGGGKCTKFKAGQTTGNLNKTFGRHLTGKHLPWGKTAYACRAPNCEMKFSRTQSRRQCRQSHGLDEDAIKLLEDEDKQIRDESTAHNKQFAPPEGHH